MNNIQRKLNNILIVIGIIVILSFAPAKTVESSVELQVQSEVGEVKIIRESEQRTIKNEIKYVFGDRWELAYAVMMSESRGKATAKNVNAGGSIDYGYFQFNDYWHPEVSYKCAIDVKCSVKEAYRVSNGGKDWSQWYGWVNGGFKEFLK